MLAFSYELLHGLELLVVKYFVNQNCKYETTKDDDEYQVAHL